MRRQSKLFFVFGFALSLTLWTGCGGDSGPQPVADVDQLQQYLEDNPDQNVDVEEEDMDIDLAEE